MKTWGKKKLDKTEIKDENMKTCEWRGNLLSFFA